MIRTSDPGGALASIAILEDDPARQAEFNAAAVRLGMKARISDNAPEFMAWLDAALPAVRLLSLDGDLFGSERPDPGSGLVVARYLASREPTKAAVLVHSVNRALSAEMVGTLEQARWTVLRVDPAPEDDLDVPLDPVQWIKLRWEAVAQGALGRSR